MSAPTREEFEKLLLDHEAWAGKFWHGREELSEPSLAASADRLVAAFSAVCAERDEWRRRAEALYGQCVEIAKCPTYYDGCHCTAATVQHNIERAEKAEAERDAALELIGRYREAERNRRAKHEIRNVEDLCEALACGCLEEGPSPSVPCAGCQSIFDFVNAALARATKAEEERDAARANARILAHAYTHDTRPPASVVAESIAYLAERP